LRACCGIRIWFEGNDKEYFRPYRSFEGVATASDAKFATAGSKFLLNAKHRQSKNSKRK